MNNTKECPNCHRHYSTQEDGSITPHRALVRNKPRGCGYPKIKPNISLEAPPTVIVLKADTSPIGHVVTLRLPGQGNATILGRCIAESSTHVEVAVNNERPDLGEWFAKKFVL